MMKRIALLLTVTFVVAGVARADSVAELVAQIPVKTSADESALAVKLMAGGESGLKELLGGLVPLGTAGKDDTKTRDAVSALVRYAGRSGGEADRATLVKAIVAALGNVSDWEIKTFLVNRLQDIGHDDAIAALSPLLTDERVALHAVMALERIGSPAAAGALAKALPDAKGNIRVAVIKSLGMLRAGTAADEMRKSARDEEDATLRMTALWALASVGDASAPELLTAEREKAKGAYDRSRLYEWTLLSASRLADAGKKKEAADVCTAVLTGDKDPVYVQGAAARTLLTIQGQGALEALMPLVERGSLPFRAAVLDAVAKTPGEAVTPALVERLKATTDAKLKEDLLLALAKRHDAAARPAVEAAAKDGDPAVRLAALTTLVSLGRDEAIAALVERITTDTPDVAKPAAEMLGRIPGDRPLAAAADALGAAPAKAKVSLLELLASRAARSQSAAVLKQAGDEDAAVRLAALRAAEKVAGPNDAGRLIELGVAAKDAGEESAAFKAVVTASSQLPAADRATALLAALKNAQGHKRAAIERAMAKLGGQAALDAVVADLKGDDAAVREGALSALAEWQDPAAIAPLLDAAEKTTDASQQVTAIRGVVSVLKNSTGLSPADKAAAYAKALAGAKRAEEKKMILGALGNERGRPAFEVAAGTQGQAGLEAESALAIIKTSIPLGKGQPGLKGDDVAPALKWAIPHCPDGTLKADAQRYLGNLEGHK